MMPITDYLGVLVGHTLTEKIKRALAGAINHKTNSISLMVMAGFLGKLEPLKQTTTQQL